jgi:hypothetical protein
MQAARDILLLAAEDAFEFERYGRPVIGDIDQRPAPRDRGVRALSPRLGLDGLRRGSSAPRSEAILDQRSRCGARSCVGFVAELSAQQLMRGFGWSARA